jgi:diguanylate cyclase (GGDEF)-like protein
MRSRLTQWNPGALRRLAGRAAGLPVLAVVGAMPAIARAAEPLPGTTGDSIAPGAVFYVGALAALMLSSLAHYFVSRERGHLEHALAALGMAIGFATTMLSRGSADSGVLSFAGFAVAGLAAALLTRDFFESASRSPRLDRALQAFATLFGLALVGAFVLPAASTGALVYAAGLIFGLFAVATGLHHHRSYAPGAGLFLAAWVAIVAGIALAGAPGLGWLRDNALTAYAMELGSAIGLLMLSVGLTARSQSALRELARTHGETLAGSEQLVERLQASEQALTQGIALRTQELEAANRRLQESEQRLRSATHQDPLTGLANRLLLNDRITQGIVRSKRHNCRTAVVLVDFDDFKQVNATFGEAVGDEVLKVAGARLRGIVREQDTVARPEGDKFVIVLEEVFDTHDVQRVATAAATELAQEFGALGQTVTISASVGSAVYPDGGTDADALLRHAAKLMRRAKRGKGLHRGTTNSASAA